MTALRIRTGLDERTGKKISGTAHLAQSLRKIWTTIPGQRFMRLDFGSNIRSALAEDITPALALQIYNDLVAAAQKYEPEYLVQSLQFVRLKETGLMALRHAGLYYPEGRLGNFDVAIPLSELARFGGSK